MFVGFIVAPTAALALGVGDAWVVGIVWYSAGATLIVGGLTVGPLVTGQAPPPLRPLQAIQIAPPALIATGGFLTGQIILGQVALGVATLLLIVLLARARWMTVAGFSGFWAAFTFPATAYVGALLVASGVFGAPGLRVAGGVLLVTVTLYVPVIVYRILKLWANGMLAAKTNASVA